MSAQYFDYFDRVWLPQSKLQLMGASRRRHRLERELVEDLIERHIENGMEAIPRLYALLLIKTLCQADPELMKEFGERVVQLDTQLRHARSA